MPPDVSRVVMERSSDNIKILQRDFGLKLEEEDKLNSREIWSDETITSIAELLLHFSSRSAELNSENNRLKAREASRDNNINEAEVLFKKAVNFGDNFAAFRDYSVFLRSQERFDDALVWCEKAITIAPERKWLKELRGEILECLKSSR